MYLNMQDCQVITNTPDVRLLYMKWQVCQDGTITKVSLAHEAN